MKKITYLLFLIVYVTSLSSQEGLRPLNSNLNYIYKDLHKTPYKSDEGISASKSQATGLFLPFNEDFFYATKSAYPDQNKWSDSLVYVNAGYPIAPPSIGVATFDGLNKNGYPYGPDLTNLILSYPADTLSSRSINLITTANSQTLDPFSDVALSFYYQARGRGDSPEISDSLIVDFFKPYANTWQSVVWFAKGNTNSNTNDTVFKRAFVRVKDTAYFHDGFKFRFRNRASITGNFDHWHVDYIYLDKGRGDSLIDTVRNDITIAEIPTSFLRDYSSMPFQQYTASEMASNLSVKIRSNSSSCLNNGYKYRIYDKTNTQIFNEYDGGYANLNPYKPNTCSPPGYGYSKVIPHAFPAVQNSFAESSDSVDFKIKHFIFLNTGTLSSTDFILNNDTVIQYQRFRNYYAFDDGTAEAGYYINGVGGKLALKITLNKPDTLRALRIYFDPVGNVNIISGPTSNYFFSLKVWPVAPGGGPDIVPILQDSMPVKKPIYYKTGYKEIPEYALSKPYYLNAGTYFIGIQQKVSTGITVGFDRNYDHHTSLYYDDGTGWAQSSFVGSVMIHPVFGKAVPAPLGLTEGNSLEQNLFHVFPNPSETYFTIHSFEAEKNSFQLFNSLGQLILTESFNSSEHQVNTESMSSGVYVIILQNQKRQTVLQQKLIIQH